MIPLPSTMNEIAEKIRKHFPQLSNPEMLADIEEKGRVMKVPAGQTMMDIGSYIKMMPLVTKGAIKVLREDKSGDELFLYFLYPGQSCAMTVQCCMANAPSTIRAIAEDDTELIALPVDVMDKWLMEHVSWKNFVLMTYSERFTELLNTIDSIVFQNLDERLMDYLKEKSKIAGSLVLKTTHQDIAYDLHSSREVISRLLKQLERKGVILLGRNKVEVLQ